jgi:D-sedoheptulose 7-phosphate isomerase
VNSDFVISVSLLLKGIKPMYNVNKKQMLDDLIKRYPSLLCVRNELEKTFEAVYSSYMNGGKLLVCGNGGSAADSEHIVGELMKSFRLKRPIDTKVAQELALMGDDGEYIADKLEGALPAIALCSHTALSTAFGNDKDSDITFAQQVYGYGQPNDVLLCLTTSGNSRNCIYAAKVARAKGMSVVSITGEGGGKIKDFSDVCIEVPERETYLVQELTLPVYHWLCAELEEAFWN